MKWLLAALFALGAVLVVAGPRGLVPVAERASSFGSPSPILPMTFVHDDHAGVQCTTCHHEFVDGTAGTTCMNCHVTDPKVAPLLEAQFHALCRSCHIEEHAAGKPSGPSRRCIGCHLPDDRF